VFIRPTIVRTAADARRITAQRYGTIRADQLRVRPNEEPSIDALVRDYLGTVPPVVVQERPGDVRFGPPPPPSTPERG
jgi:general secretion pathway protein D